MKKGAKAFLTESIRLMNTLKVLGFGTEEPINGGDVVEAIGELWPDLERSFTKLEM